MNSPTAKQASAQAEVAPPLIVSANKTTTGQYSGEAQRALPNTSAAPQRPALIEAEVDIVAVHLWPRRDGSGCFKALVLAHPDYQEAVCFSGELPFVPEPGQKVRIRGRQDAYRGKSQIIFWARDIAQVAQAADNPDLVSKEATVGRVTSQSGGRAWKAFSISSGGYESASGDIPFGIHDGQRLRLQGFKGLYREKPQLLVCRAQPLGVEYVDDRRRIFTQNKIPPRYVDDLVAALGSDFAARVSADPDLISSALARTKTATRAKIKEACARIEAQDVFEPSQRNSRRSS